MTGSMMRLASRLLMLLAPVVLAGCALLPEAGESARMLALSGTTHSLQADPESERIVRSWPRTQWWRDFHSPELDRLIGAAVKDSPTLAAATARLQQAEAMADHQAAEMLPSVGASVELQHRRFSGTDFYGPNGGKTFTGAYLDPMVLRYHLDLWGQDRAALEAALGRERAQASELAVARLLLGTAVARSYFRLCAAEEEAELTGTASQRLEGLLQLAQLRAERGLAPEDAVQRVRQKLESARQREASLRADAQMLRHRLAALAGQGPDWGDGIRVASTEFAERFPLPERLALSLLAHRPDVAAARWRVEAAAQLVKVAETKFYPDINLVGFAGLRALNLKDLFLSHGASVAYSVGPTVTLPIFEGGRLEAELKNQQAGYDAAVAAYNGALLAAVQQVADALARWRASQVHDAAQDLAQRAAEAALALSERRYRAGLSARDEEIEAALGVVEQRLNSSRFRSDRLQAAVELIEALGGGYQDSTNFSTLVAGASS